MGFLKKSSANLRSSFKGLKGSIFAKTNNSIIHNRFVLYFIFLISLGNLFYLTVERDFKSIIIFVIVGFLTAFFSKNMVIILVVALALTNILKFGAKITREGLEGSEEEKEEKEGLEDGEKEEKEKEEFSNSDDKAESSDDKKTKKDTPKTEKNKEMSGDKEALQEIQDSIKSILKNQK